MLNKQPIFINGFSYGGTNLIMNFLASHPGVTFLSGETHEVFTSKPNRKLDKLIRSLFYTPIRIATGLDLFGRMCLEERPPLSAFLEKYIDLIFFIDKMTTERNKYKSEDERYALGELSRSRFLGKNVNGVVLATPVLADIYPDATFFAIVRNGFALMDGYIRRGWPVRNFASMYDKVCRRIIDDSKRIPNYHIVRFEDMISDPAVFIRSIYEQAGLDTAMLSKVRMQSKKSMDEKGNRTYTFGGAKDREVHWFRLDEIDRYIRRDIDRNQMVQVSNEDRKALLELASLPLEEFGYLR